MADEPLETPRPDHGRVIRAAVIGLVASLVALVVPGIAGDDRSDVASDEQDAVIAAPSTPSAPQAPAFGPSGLGLQAPTAGGGGVATTAIAAATADVAVAVAPPVGPVVGPPTLVVPPPPVGGDDGPPAAEDPVAGPDAGPAEPGCYPAGLVFFGVVPDCDTFAGWETCLLPNGVVVFGPLDCSVIEWLAMGGIGDGATWQSDGPIVTTNAARDGTGRTTVDTDDGAATGAAGDRTTAATDGDGATSGVAKKTAAVRSAKDAARKDATTGTGGESPTSTAGVTPTDAGQRTAAAGAAGAPSTLGHICQVPSFGAIGADSCDDFPRVVASAPTCELRAGWVLSGSCASFAVPDCAIVGATGPCEGWLDGSDGVLGIDNPSVAAGAAGAASAAGRDPATTAGATTDGNPDEDATGHAVALGSAAAGPDDEVEVAVAASASASADGLAVTADVADALVVDPRATEVLVQLYGEVAALAALRDEVVTVSVSLLVERVGTDVLLTVDSTVVVGRDGEPRRVQQQRRFTATDATTPLAIDGPLLAGDLLATPTSPTGTTAALDGSTWTSIRGAVADHLAALRDVVAGADVPDDHLEDDQLESLDESGGDGATAGGDVGRNDAEAAADADTDADSNATGAAAGAASTAVGAATADPDGSTTADGCIASSTTASVEHDGEVVGDADQTGDDVEGALAGEDCATSDLVDVGEVRSSGGTTTVATDEDVTASATGSGTAEVADDGTATTTADASAGGTTPDAEATTATASPSATTVTVDGPDESLEPEEDPFDAVTPDTSPDDDPDGEGGSSEAPTDEATGGEAISGEAATAP